MNTRSALLMITLSILMLTTGCPNKDGTTTLAWLENTSVIDVWRRTEIQKFKGEELYGIINGGASLYLENGLSHGIRAQYSTTKSQECELFFYVLADSLSAQKLFQEKQEELSHVDAIDGYIEEKMMVSKTIGATLIFGWNGHGLLEMNVSGFHKYQEALSSAKPFLADF